MKNINVISTFLAIAALSLGSAAAADTPMTKATTITGLASMPLAFTENQGQWDEQVLFRSNAGGATMWFAKDGAYYQFTRRVRVGQEPCAPDISDEDVGTTGVPTYRGTDVTQPGEPVSGVEGRLPVPRSSAVGSDRFRHEPDSLETMMIKASFVGANPNPRMVGEDLLEYKCNYFLGNDPAKWRTNVPNYQAIVYQEVYPGIDLKYYGNGKQMEYDFIVSPGADFTQISIQYEGAKSLSVDAAGRLVVETDWGEVIEQRPVVYQMSGGDSVSLAGEYVLKGDKAFGFELPDGYDADLPLVIDPTLDYSTYLGGSDYDIGYGIAVDISGAAYVTGNTYSTNFPTENPYQKYAGDADAFVTKLSSDGSSLKYSTYLGGSADDNGHSIAVDTSGAAYVTGYTCSSDDFPTEDPYQTYQGAGDVFVTKLSSSGNSLIYSTYLGGNDLDFGFGIAVDTSGAAYVTGRTRSTDFPTENPYQTDQGGPDVFITKLSSSGSSLVYSTYLGGNSADEGWGIAVDTSGAAYVTGYTYSSDFPTENPYQTDQPHRDAFVTKLNSSGSSVVYSTYLGGNGTDYGYGIAVDVFGAAYVRGITNSIDFPTENPYQTYKGSWDAFVTKLSSSGSSLVYSTYLGGIGIDYGLGIAVDDSGAAYVTGYTESPDFPTTPDAYDTSHNVWWDFDAFVTKFFDTGSCCNHDGIRGDANYDMSLNVADLTYLVDYLFFSGSAPPCPVEGDVDGSGGINVADLTYLVDYLFFEGPTPPPCP